MSWHSIRPSALVPLLLGIGAFSPAAHAQGGMISVCPTTVNAPGVWKVTRNLMAAAECITIKASGAAIDLGGYTITSPSTGILAWGVGEEGAGKFSHVIIANGTIKNFEYGVLLETTTNATIAKITAVENGDGIVAYKSVVITETQANNNVTFGMRLINTNNTVVNSHANGNGVAGMSLQNAGGNTVINSEASNNKAINGGAENGGMLISGTNNSLIGNTTNHNVNFGISVNCPSDLFANTASGNNPARNITTSGTGCARLDNNPAP
jgi:parallel beta-helix repeat protein